MRNERSGGVCLELVEKVNVWTHGRRTGHSHKDIESLNKPFKTHVHKERNQCCERCDVEKVLSTL
jgi:hypothetical protein